MTQTNKNITIYHTNQRYEPQGKPWTQLSGTAARRGVSTERLTFLKGTPPPAPPPERDKVTITALSVLP